MIKHRLLVAMFAGMALTGWSQQTVIVESYNDGENSDGFSQVEGTWHESVAKSAADGLTATRGRYNDADEEPATARFTPDLPSAGKYEVFITYPPSGNASDIIYRINTADGVQNLRLTQFGRELSHRPAADQWHSVGVYNFEAGQNGYLEISDPLTGERPQDSEPNARIYADAVKFVKVADSTPVTDLQSDEGLEPGVESTTVAETAPVADPTTAPEMPAIAGEEIAALPSLPGMATPAGNELPGLPDATPSAASELPGLPGSVPAAAPGLPSLPTEQTPGAAAPGLPSLPAGETPAADAPVAPGLPQETAPDPAAVLPGLPGTTPAPGTDLPSLPSAPAPADTATGELPNLPGTPAPIATPNLPSLAPVTPTPVHIPPSPAETPAPATASLRQPGLTPAIPTPASAGLALPTPIPGATPAPTVAVDPSAEGSFSITQYNPSQLDWMYDFGAAQSAARTQGRKVLVFFTAEHNRVAQSYETEMFNDPGVRQALSQYVLMKADFSRNTRLAYSLGVFGAGVIAVVNEDGAVTSRVVQKPASGTELITQLQTEKAVRATPPPNPQFTPEVPMQSASGVPANAMTLPPGTEAPAADGGMSALPGQALPAAPAAAGTPGSTDPAGMATLPGLPAGTPAAVGPADAATLSDATAGEAPASGTAMDALPELPGMAQ